MTFDDNNQRWSRGHKARGQGQGQRHKKISRLRPRTDPLEAKDQAHRRKRSPQKKGLQNFFSGDLKKKGLQNLFSGDLYTWGNQKKVFADFPQGFWRFPTKFQRFKNSAVLEARTGQFSRTWGFEAKAKDFKMCPSVLEDVLEAKDVLEDSTSAWNPLIISYYHIGYSRNLSLQLCVA